MGACCSSDDHHRPVEVLEHHQPIVLTTHGTHYVEPPPATIVVTPHGTHYVDPHQPTVIVTTQYVEPSPTVADVAGVVAAGMIIDHALDHHHDHHVEVVHVEVHHDDY